MGIDGSLSEKDKKALQSETWQTVREGMKKRMEVKHFTTERTAENAYGWTWDQVVKEYLRTGYKAEGSNPDIEVLGVTYKTLKRPEVTVFYDAAGDTLFDVTNERLEKEYEWLMNSGAGAENEDYEEDNRDAAEGENTGMGEKEEGTETGETSEDGHEEDAENGEPITPMGKTIAGIEIQAFEAAVLKDTPAITSNKDDTDKENLADDVIPMGTASLKDIVTGLPAPTAEEIEAAKEENAKPVKQRAKEKLEKEQKAAKDSTFADPIIEYLLKRCEEDEGLAQDVVQEHKTWQKCFDYIFSQARKQSKGNCAAVRDDVVYEWAEDYYHKDDKAEEAEKAKRESEAKVKREKVAAEKKATAKNKPAKAAEKLSADRNKSKTPAKEEKHIEQPKPKKSGKDMEGQLDMFSMMEM